MKLVSLFVSILFAVNAAQAAPQHGFTAEQRAEMAVANEKAAANAFLNDLFGPLNGNAKDTTTKRLPWAETNEAGWIIISDENDFGTDSIKLSIAENLPEGMKLLVFTGATANSYQKSLFKAYSKVLDPSRLKIVYLPGGGRGFWARDGVPVPAWTFDEAGNKKFTVVDAKYYHQFEADKEVADYFTAEYVKHSYYTEGGNFMSNNRGECIVVNNERVAKMPDTTFESAYGCKSTLRLEYVKGIGHIDESVKFIDDDTVITDYAGYVEILEDAGYKVIMAPRPSNAYETYVNTLIVNGTAFMPAFNQATDIKAIEMYESFGLKVIPLNSISLSNDGLGSIHCITMTYPPVPFNELLESIGAEDVTQ